ncbi:methyl-accepting chemotaxis protein [Actimicrobium antarcticum]|uniref:Methyl-accepting chemotaxis protein n=1 Tax=Actimicrobium antarcticum TaxID=1051899 RepID=A0ABP7TH49_9BURK
MLNNLRIGIRLGGAFGLVLCFAAALAITGILTLSSVMGSFRIVTNSVLPKTELANQNIQAAYDYARAFAYIVTSDGRPGADQASIARARSVLVDTVKLVNDNTKTLEKMLSSDQEKALLATVVAQRKAYGASRNQVLEMKKAEQNDRAVELMFTQTNSLQTVYIQAIKDFIAYENALTKSGIAAAESTFANSQSALLILFAVTLILGIFISVSITRGLLKSLGGEPDYAAAIAGKIADGDLTVAVQVAPHDEASLLFAMKRMCDGLVGIVGQVRSGTNVIVTASSEIASGNLDLSSRTEQQASALEETASSMEELTSTVKQNGENARQANQLAASASEIAVKGGAVVAQVIGTMSEINESARKIVDIISVIDGIAFQTNILALNAAVEAARAGEQGRGFAVVATEVRSLAQRSAGAAKEIKQLIGDSVEKVDAGSRLVNQAGATMDEIVASVKRVTDIMSEIASAGREQEAGIQQINTAITEMDTVTQQNAALVEQAAAAAESLQDQAAGLAKVVSVFKLNDDVRALSNPLAATSVHSRAATGLHVKSLASRTTPAPIALTSVGHTRSKARNIRIDN